MLQWGKRDRPENGGDTYEVFGQYRSHLQGAALCGAFRRRQAGRLPLRGDLGLGFQELGGTEGPVPPIRVGHLLHGRRRSHLPVRSRPRGGISGLSPAFPEGRPGCGLQAAGRPLQRAAAGAQAVRGGPVPPVQRRGEVHGHVPLPGRHRPGGGGSRRDAVPGGSECGNGPPGQLPEVHQGRGGDREDGGFPQYKDPVRRLPYVPQRGQDHRDPAEIPVPHRLHPHCRRPRPGRARHRLHQLPGGAPGPV